MAVAELPQNHLQREEHPRDRRVERRRDTARRRHRDEALAPLIVEPENTAHNGRDRRAELHHRTLGAERRARADGERRC